MSVENVKDLEGIRAAGRVVAAALAAMRAAVRAGISTGELDAIGAERIARHGGHSAPRMVYGFPGSNLHQRQRRDRARRARTPAAGAG